MGKPKTYPITVNVLEKSDAGFTCECERRQKAEAHLTFLTTGQPPVVLGEAYLCKDCADEVRKTSEKK